MSRKTPKSHKTNSKDVRCKENDDAHSGGGIADDTAEVKRKSEDHRCQRIHSTYSKICSLTSVLRKVLEMQAEQK